jgi:hypothetical protein
LIFTKSASVRHLRAPGAADFRRLRTPRVNFAQGYLLVRPMAVRSRKHAGIFG